MGKDPGNSSHGWLQTQRSARLCLPIAMTKGVGHHSLLRVYCYSGDVALEESWSLVNSAEFSLSSQA